MLLISKPNAVLIFIGLKNFVNSLKIKPILVKDE